MTRYTKQSVTSLAGINSELTKIQTALQDTLSRKSDVPNQMEGSLDMNSERILNLPDPISDHEPVTLGAVQNFVDQAQGVNIVQEATPTAGLRQGVRWYKPSEATTYVYYCDGDSCQWVQEPVQSADGTLRDELAGTDSSVLIADVEAQDIARDYKLADALEFPNGAFWQSPVLSERTMVDIKNFQGQDGTFPAKEPVIVHDYSDGRRTVQLDKVGGNGVGYVLGLRRANNPINRPDKPADFVSPDGYLECSYDSFDGIGGAKLVNKSFYIDPNANLVWVGKNGNAVTSAQFIQLKPNGDGRYPFWFTATQEQDLFMRWSNPSGDVLAVRDDVAGTRTHLIVDSNQTSGLRISCLAGTLDLSAGTNIIVRNPVITASGVDLTLTAAKDLLLGATTGSIKADKPFRPRAYSVSSVPAAVDFNQHIVFVTNGDAGAPCLAVSNGTNWLRIALGAAISST
jgi:hypothetical protein